MSSSQELSIDNLMIGGRYTLLLTRSTYINTLPLTRSSRNKYPTPNSILRGGNRRQCALTTQFDRSSIKYKNIERDRSQREMSATTTDNIIIQKKKQRFLKSKLSLHRRILFPHNFFFSFSS